MKKKKTNIIYIAITLIVSILLIIFIIHAFSIGALTSNKALIKYVEKFGIIAPSIFMLIQIMQVVLPVIPGGASCAAGVLAFGPFWGFVYNYISLTIGSIIAYYLSQKYGMSIIEKLFKQKTINKYIKYIRNKTFEKIFMWGIIIPGAPDDLLCYLAGISSINFKKFIIIIILGKPLSLLLYSIAFYLVPSLLL